MEILLLVFGIVAVIYFRKSIKKVAVYSETYATTYVNESTVELIQRNTELKNEIEANFANGNFVTAEDVYKLLNKNKR